VDLSFRKLQELERKVQGEREGDNLLSLCNLYLQKVQSEKLSSNFLRSKNLGNFNSGSHFQRVIFLLVGEDMACEGIDSGSLMKKEKEEEERGRKKDNGRERKRKERKKEKGRERRKEGNKDMKQRKAKGGRAKR